MKPLKNKVKPRIVQINLFDKILQLCCLFISLPARMKGKINWDALGIGASLACAIHCALLPLFFSTLPLFGINIIHHLGFVAWGGAGFMGPTPGKIEGVLPNAGLGLRIEVQPRMNVRLDFGRNFINRQNLFYFNMTEAF